MRTQTPGETSWGPHFFWFFCESWERKLVFTGSVSGGMWERALLFSATTGPLPPLGITTCADASLETTAVAIAAAQTAQTPIAPPDRVHPMKILHPCSRSTALPGRLF